MNRTVEHICARDKAVVFVNHIKRHLYEMDVEPPREVICKICGKTIDEIWEEETRKGNHVFIQPGIYEEGKEYVDRNGRIFCVKSVRKEVL